jgi:hypothetical protein
VLCNLNETLISVIVPFGSTNLAAEILWWVFHLSDGVCIQVPFSAALKSNATMFQQQNAEMCMNTRYLFQLRGAIRLSWLLVAGSVHSAFSLSHVMLHGDHYTM